MTTNLTDSWRQAGALSMYMWRERGFEALLQLVFAYSILAQSISWTQNHKLQMPLLNILSNRNKILPKSSTDQNVPKQQFCSCSTIQSSKRLEPYPLESSFPCPQKNPVSTDSLSYPWGIPAAQAHGQCCCLFLTLYLKLLHPVFS